MFPVYPIFLRYFDKEKYEYYRVQITVIQNPLQISGRPSSLS